MSPVLAFYSTKLLYRIARHCASAQNVWILAQATNGSAPLNLSKMSYDGIEQEILQMNDNTLDS